MCSIEPTDLALLRSLSSIQQLDGTDDELFRWSRDCGWRKGIVQGSHGRRSPHLMTLSVIEALRAGPFPTIDPLFRLDIENRRGHNLRH
jgi:hypothetical protein